MCGWQIQEPVADSVIKDEASEVSRSENGWANIERKH